MLERARNRPDFGNAGEIDILLNAAKICQQKRLSSGRSTTRVSDAILDAADFDENFDRANKNEASVPKLFEGVVGSTFGTEWIDFAPQQVFVEIKKMTNNDDYFHDELQVPPTRHADEFLFSWHLRYG
ncbi:hypothetical protein PENSUB_12886 [Penicillium subrubescens]|uniref:CbbX AAA lid domain-containing protein n=1 Tax=Penicillium subrubescens TaxID=1316194 RepID=A0A1Q5SWG2_9EURO|nr:hypothetical protein PENSUB_12886 [Penicillium subrubescens]